MMAKLLRSWVRICATFGPGLAIVAMDVAFRGERISRLDHDGKLAWALSAVGTVVLWGALVTLAARGGRLFRLVFQTLLVLFAVVVVAGQAYTFVRYAAYVNHRAVLVGTNMLPSVGSQLWADRATVGRLIAPVVALALLAPAVRRALRDKKRDFFDNLSARRAGDLLVVGLLLFATLDPDHFAEQGAPPDVLYIQAMGQLAKARWVHDETVERLHPGKRTPRPIPALAAAPARPRNVLFVLTESVRAQSVCVDPKAPCEITPFSHRAAPERLPLLGMRGVDSTTAISLAVFWSGVAPTASREAFHEMPLLWEYAAAAGIDTAYWTSQNLLFGNSGTWLEGVKFRHHTNATTLDPDADLDTGADDAKLVDKVLVDLPDMREPFYGVVHLSNTHFPYLIKDELAPFQPQMENSGPGYEIPMRNRYHDAIYAQDWAVGKLIDGVRKSPFGERTVIVYLSDHGEQMREKGAVGHTGTLYEQELRIPAWIDAPRGTLTDSEHTALTTLRSAPLLTLDVFPTMMDLLGLWDRPKLGSLAAEIPGQSLLRGGSDPLIAREITNCTALWACAFRNWGAISGTRKLIACQADRDWLCYDVANDPGEEHPLPKERCADLLPMAERTGRPF